jgi:hypothetical protein
MKQARPRARTEGLIVRKLDDEVLIYDRDGDRATCLNAFAADVWERCDGRTTPATLARTLARERSQVVEESAVRLALDELSRAGLLEPDGNTAPSRYGESRREVLRKLGVGAAVAVPMITSIVVPTMADAASCLGFGAPCMTDPDCCSSNCVNGLCDQNLFHTPDPRSRPRSRK